MFYGWRILLVVFLNQFFAIGSTSYAFSLLKIPIGEEFGASDALVNLGMILILLGNAVFAVVVGKLVDRYPARIIVAVGALVMGLGFCAIAVAPSLWVIGLICVTALACGMATLGPTVGSTLVVNWFYRMRGRVLGLSAVSTSLGGFLILPFLAVMIDWLGWRTAVVVLGILLVAVLLPLSFLLYNRPEEKGLFPDGDAEPPIISAAEAERIWAIPELLVTRDFWLIGIAMGIFGGVMSAYLASAVRHAHGLGFSLEQGAFVVSVYSIVSIAGKTCFGFLADKLDKRALWGGSAVVAAASCLVLISEPGYPLLALVAGIFGLSAGAIMPLWGGVIGDRFGARSYGTIMGLMGPLIVAFNVGGIYFVGLVYDLNGDYDLAFKLYCGALLVSAVLFAIVQLHSDRSNNKGNAAGVNG